MNPSPTQNPAIKYYRSRQSAGVSSALVIMLGVISIGSSFARHSLMLTSSLLAGAIVVWYVGYWLLSKNFYFVSSTKAGFKDAFRMREVQFNDVRSATIRVGRGSRNLVFECDGETVRLPLDPMDEAWLSAVKAELSKRGISVSTTPSVPNWRVNDVDHFRPRLSLAKNVPADTTQNPCSSGPIRG